LRIISDTGPIIALAKAKRLKLLQSLFHKVLIVPAVYKELMVKAGDESAEIDAAINEFIHLSKLPISDQKIEAVLQGLGVGEKQSIQYAHSEPNDSILIMDDKLGRYAAKKLDIPIMGTIGVLLIAKNKSLIDNLTKVVLEIRNNGYWISDDIIALAQKIAGE
jgi:uncharacterized protein